MSSSLSFLKKIEDYNFVGPEEIALNQAIAAAGGPPLRDPVACLNAMARLDISLPFGLDSLPIVATVAGVHWRRALFPMSGGDFRKLVAAVMLTPIETNEIDPEILKKAEAAALKFPASYGESAALGFLKGQLKKQPGGDSAHQEDVDEKQNNKKSSEQEGSKTNNNTSNNHNVSATRQLDLTAVNKSTSSSAAVAATPSQNNNNNNIHQQQDTTLSRGRSVRFMGASFRNNGLFGALDMSAESSSSSSSSSEDEEDLASTQNTNVRAFASENKIYLQDELYHRKHDEQQETEQVLSELFAVPRPLQAKKIKSTTGGNINNNNVNSPLTRKDSMASMKTTQSGGDSNNNNTCDVSSHNNNNNGGGDSPQQPPICFSAEKIGSYFDQFGLNPKAMLKYFQNSDDLEDMIKHANYLSQQRKRERENTNTNLSNNNNNNNVGVSSATAVAGIDSFTPARNNRNNANYSSNTPNLTHINDEVIISPIVSIAETQQHNNNNNNNTTRSVISHDDSTLFSTAGNRTVTNDNDVTSSLNNTTNSTFFSGASLPLQQQYSSTANPFLMASVVSKLSRKKSTLGMTRVDVPTVFEVAIDDFCWWLNEPSSNSQGYNTPRTSQRARHRWRVVIFAVLQTVRATMRGLDKGASSMDLLGGGQEGGFIGFARALFNFTRENRLETTALKEKVSEAITRLDKDHESRFRKVKIDEVKELGNAEGAMKAMPADRLSVEMMLRRMCVPVYGDSGTAVIAKQIMESRVHRHASEAVVLVPDNDKNTSNNNNNSDNQNRHKSMTREERLEYDENHPVRGCGANAAGVRQLQKMESVQKSDVVERLVRRGENKKNRNVKNRKPLYTSPTSALKYESDEIGRERDDERRKNRKIKNNERPPSTFGIYSSSIPPRVSRPSSALNTSINFDKNVKAARPSSAAALKNVSGTFSSLTSPKQEYDKIANQKKREKLNKEKEKRIKLQQRKRERKEQLEARNKQRRGEQRTAQKSTDESSDFESYDSYTSTGSSEISSCSSYSSSSSSSIRSSSSSNISSVSTATISSSSATRVKKNMKNSSDSARNNGANKEPAALRQDSTGITSAISSITNSTVDSRIQQRQQTQSQHKNISVMITPLKIPQKNSKETLQKVTSIMSSSSYSSSSSSSISSFSDDEEETDNIHGSEKNPPSQQKPPRSAPQKQMTKQQRKEQTEQEELMSKWTSSRDRQNNAASNGTPQGKQTEVIRALREKNQQSQQQNQRPSSALAISASSSSNQHNNNKSNNNASRGPNFQEVQKRLRPGSALTADRYHYFEHNPNGSANDTIEKRNKVTSQDFYNRYRSPTLEEKSRRQQEERRKRHPERHRNQGGNKMGEEHGAEEEFEPLPRLAVRDDDDEDVLSNNYNNHSNLHHQKHQNTNQPTRVYRKSDNRHYEDSLENTTNSISGVLTNLSQPERSSISRNQGRRSSAGETTEAADAHTSLKTDDKMNNNANQKTSAKNKVARSDSSPFDHYSVPVSPLSRTMYSAVPTTPSESNSLISSALVARADGRKNSNQNYNNNHVAVYSSSSSKKRPNSSTSGLYSSSNNTNNQNRSDQNRNNGESSPHGGASRTRSASSPPNLSPRDDGAKPCRTRRKLDEVIKVQRLSDRTQLHDDNLERRTLEFEAIMMRDSAMNKIGSHTLGTMKNLYGQHVVRRKL